MSLSVCASVCWSTSLSCVYIRFVGISQANRALTKPSRVKIRSKTFPMKNMLGLCYTLYIYCVGFFSVLFFFLWGGGGEGRGCKGWGELSDSTFAEAMTTHVPEMESIIIYSTGGHNFMGIIY